jgi:two-component system LytT family response regulator
MIKTFLVDDETGNSAILSAVLSEYCPSVLICGTASSVDEAIPLILKTEPQLIFLDIQMPGGTGFDLLDRIARKNLEVIFVTAYNDFLLRAIRYSAVDYIMKPISVTDLVAAVGRAEERISAKLTNHQLNLLLSNIKQPTAVQRIAVLHKNVYIFVAISDIVRFEAKGAYTNIILNTKTIYTVAKNIKEYEEILPAEIFCRVHNSHLVNINFIKTYHKGRGGHIELLCGTSIEVSIRRKEEFLNRFGK